MLNTIIPRTDSETISRAFEIQPDAMLTFARIILEHEKTGESCGKLSEPSLARDWLLPEEDAAWKNL